MDIEETLSSYLAKGWAGCKPSQNLQEVLVPSKTTTNQIGQGRNGGHFTNKNLLVKLRNKNNSPLTDCARNKPDYTEQP